MNVTLYSKPACGQCKATDIAFGKKKIEATKINLPDFPEKLEQLKSEGLMQAPIIEVLDAEGNRVDIWTGFRPDKINEWAPSLAGAAAA